MMTSQADQNRPFTPTCARLLLSFNVISLNYAKSIALSLESEIHNYDNTCMHRNTLAEEKRVTNCRAP